MLPLRQDLLVGVAFEGDERIGIRREAEFVEGLCRLADDVEDAPRGWPPTWRPFGGREVVLAEPRLQKWACPMEED